MDSFGKMDMSLNEILGLENEYELLSKQAKVRYKTNQWKMANNEKQEF